MRSASGRFGLNLGRSNKEQAIDKDGDSSIQNGHNRAVSGNSGTGGVGLGGAGDIAKSVKGRIAHTTILPSLIGNQNLRELQDLITNEKSIIQNQDKLGNSISTSGQSLAAWGSTQGSDLSDILSHANSILAHLAQAFHTYAARSGDIRVLLKSMRSREEELEELLKRRRQTGSRAEREEKKLAKMGQENKNLQAQTELLQSLREQMRQMDTDILIEEAKLGDFKRRVTKEALGIKFGGCFELAEKAQIVGELGKLLIEEIPLEETPPGYGRAPYEGFEQTQRLSTEADRVIKEVAYQPPVVKSLPPGLPHSRPMEPLQTGSAINLNDSSIDEYRRTAAQYSDDPADNTRSGYTPVLSSNPYNDHSTMTSSYPAPPHHAGSHVMFAAPDSPGYQGESSRDAVPVVESEEHNYEYEQARQNELEDRNHQQAEINAREGDDAYAADATIMPAKHIFPVHATPEVTKLSTAPALAPALAPPLVMRSASDLSIGLDSARNAPPPYNLVERGSTRTLTIGDWTIKSIKRPILNGQEIDSATDHLKIPLPEMTFGNNSLDLEYTPKGVPQPLSLKFTSLAALAGVASGEGWEERVGGGVQVAMAESWSQNRTQGTSYLSDIPISDKPTNPFDWTYSTIFSGEVDPAGFDFVTSDSDTIPMDLLARQDPVLDKIIFYDDVSLFEDELHDNGESIMNVRIRVMPHSFFILSRLFLRVDNVLFRTHDVRIFHAFGSNKVIREVMGRECTYKEMKDRLESQDDLSPLNDTNFVTQVLSSLPIASSSSSTKAWPGLGVRRELLDLDRLNEPVSLHNEPESVPISAVPEPMRPEEAVAQPPSHAGLTTAELQAQSKPAKTPSIMDRPRGVRRSGDPPGDGTFGGYNYAYENNAYFVRNHASSPSFLPQEEEVLPGVQSTIDSGTPMDREAFYTPVGTPDLARPTPVFHHPGTGQRTISASAFRRNKTSLNTSIDAGSAQAHDERSPAQFSTSPRIAEAYQDHPSQAVRHDALPLHDDASFHPTAPPVYREEPAALQLDDRNDDLR